MACRDCFRGGIHTHATPVGYMTTVHNTTCYVSPGSTDTTAGTKPSSTTDSTAATAADTTPSQHQIDFSRPLILYLPDGFGLPLVNNKLLADTYAARTGFTVIAPDIPPGGGLHIDALALTDTITDPVAWTDVSGQLARVWAVVRLVPIAVPFVLNKNKREVCREEMIELGRWVKGEMARVDGGKGKGRLGVAGFCYGGWLATKMGCAALDPKVEEGKDGGVGDGDGEDEQNRIVDALFTAHPSWLKTPDEMVQAVRRGVPYSMALGDKDMTLPLEKAEEIEAALTREWPEGEGEKYEVKIYRGDIPHGFAVRAREGYEGQIQAEREACEQAVAWFRKHLL